MSHAETRLVASTEPHPRSARAGLTLLEVVIAAAILATVLLGVFSAMAHTMRVESLSREREAATRAALQELENQVMAVGTTAQFDALVSGPLDYAFDVEYESGSGPILLKPAMTSPHASGRVGRLTVSAIAEGTWGGVARLIEARAHVRWHSSGSDDGTTDNEVVITARKARPN